MKLSAKIGIILSIIIGTTSCSGYSELLKSDDYAKKFEAANAYYDAGATAKVKYRKNDKKIEEKGLIRKEKYGVSSLNRAIALYEQIYQRMPKGEEGELSYFRIGKAYYLSGDYYMAGYYLGMFPTRFPFSPRGEESLFLGAMCSVNNSPASSLDQADTEIAIRDLQYFIDAYPQSALVDSCNNLIDGMRFKLEKKAFQAVELYDKTERYLAAVTAGETFVDDYPLSKYRENVHRMVVNNSYLIAINSVVEKKAERIDETTERYNTFVSQFPNSAYLKQLEKQQEMLQEMKSELADKGKTKK